MLGLDDNIAGLADGVSISVALLVAVLLGLRHATDPDHLAAVTSLVAGGGRSAGRVAGKLGLSWGLGHATTLLAFGVPVILFDEYLPEPVQRAAELAIALVIVGLAARLLHRWRRGQFHIHEHEHHGTAHLHVHSHSEDGDHAHPHRARSPLGAYGIGLIHGIGGSAGVGVLILATVDSNRVAVASLVLLALFTAISMTMLSTGLGLMLASRPVRTVFDRVAPVLGFASLAFGVWYGLGALELASYQL